MSDAFVHPLAFVCGDAVLGPRAQSDSRTQTGSAVGASSRRGDAADS